MTKFLETFMFWTGWAGFLTGFFLLMLGAVLLGQHNQDMIHFHQLVWMGIPATLPDDPVGVANFLVQWGALIGIIGCGFVIMSYYLPSMFAGVRRYKPPSRMFVHSWRL